MRKTAFTENEEERNQLETELIDIFWKKENTELRNVILSNGEPIGFYALGLGLVTVAYIISFDENARNITYSNSPERGTLKHCVNMALEGKDGYSGFDISPEQPDCAM